MLVLKRMVGQEVLIEVGGEAVLITLTDGFEGGARIGVSADRRHRVARDDVWTERQRLLAEVAKAAGRKAPREAGHEA